MLIPVVKAIAGFFSDSKTYKLLLLFAGLLTANAKYTDDAKDAVLKELYTEKRERMNWEHQREQYGNLFLRYNDERWDQQYKWNNRALEEIRDTHKDVKELLKRN